MKTIYAINFYCRYKKPTKMTLETQEYLSTIPLEHVTTNPRSRESSIIIEPLRSSSTLSR